MPGTIVLLLASLWLGPPPDSATVRPDPEAYATAVAELGRANAAVTEDPNMTSARLAEALLAVHEHMRLLAEDRAVRGLIVTATLNLVSLQLLDAPALAPLTMDRLITQQHGEFVPAERFGPQIEELYNDRLERLEGQGFAAIEVDCSVRCRVFIDGREAPIVVSSLYLGVHDVWIEEFDGQNPMRESVTLGHNGERRVISYGPVRSPEHERPDALPTRPLARVAPRWVEASLIGVGAIMLVGGATAISMHGVCPKLDQADCPKVFDARALGTTLVGLGGISLGSGAVMLGIDRVRLDHTAAIDVSLGWRVRF